MKQSLAMLLAVLALFALAACGNSTSQTTTSSTEPNQATTCSHSWEPATCTAPKTCSKCKTTEGKATGHSWEAATCTAPKTCSKCKVTEGKATGHSWKTATCTAPKTCSKCKTTEGKATGHSWEAATCTAPKTCSKCKATEGSAVGHNFSNNICTICKEPDPAYANALDISERIKIYGTYIYVNSADGVSTYITWENKSVKEIKYISFRVELYNRVHDRLRCDISRNYEKWLQQTGPIPKGKGMYTGGSNRHFLPDVSEDVCASDESNGWANRYWENVWYNSSAHYVKITGIKIEYMDGTTYSMLDKEAFDKLDIINVTQSESVYDYDYKYPVSATLLGKDFPYEDNYIRIDKLLIDKVEGVGENEAIFVCRLQGYNYCRYSVSLFLEIFDEKGNRIDSVYDVFISDRGDFTSWEFYVSTPRTGTYYIAVDYVFG